MFLSHSLQISSNGSNFTKKKINNEPFYNIAAKYVLQINTQWHHVQNGDLSQKLNHRVLTVGVS